MPKPTFAELLEGAKIEVAAGRGAVNCTYILAAQDKAYPRTCQRCGLGLCPFSDKLMAARPQEKPTTPSREEAPERVLLSCPMCGRIDSDDNAVQESPINVTEFKAASGGLGYRVECSCGTSGPSARGAETAGDLWNTRADLANREPSEGDVITLDSSAYKHEFYGILNAQGQFWTPLAFDSEGAARAHIAAFWNTPKQVEHFMRRAKIVPVRVQLTAIQAPEEAP